MSERNLPFWLMQAESFAVGCLHHDNFADRLDFMRIDINRANHELYCGETKDCYHYPKKEQAA